MLKWLRQKPTSGGPGHETSEKMTTDDPLATIQVHPINTKKSLKSISSSSANEIYAVSRVNPLFEEEEVGKGLLFSPGIHSGSSGYDSGPSDDDIPTSKLPGPHNSSDGRQANGVPMPKQFPQLFSDKDDLLIHHEATMVGTAANGAPGGGHPVLHIVQQNSAYVKNIAVTLAPSAANRPLSPIPELQSAKTMLGAQARKVSAISVPTRNVVSIKPGDSLGAAKVLQRSLNYVQSIRIGPSPARNASFTRNGGYSQQNALSSQQNPSRNKGVGASPLGRKPSVTFSEKVDVVDGKAALGSASSSRRSSEQDSIVTDSLLMMTSGHQLILNHKKGKRVSSIVTAEVHGRPEPQRKDQMPDLTSFSNSPSKNRIVKQIVSTSSSSHKDEDDNISIHSHENHYDDVENSAASDNSDSSSSSAPKETQVRPRSITTGSKSPFGGIADHYAAAKEIAKEIESYSSGTTKSTRISLVRDLLLSSRGRGGGGSSSSPPSGRTGRGRNDELVLKVDGHSRTLLKTVVQIQAGSQAGDQPWVQPPVYVKASNGNALTTTETTSPLGGHHLENSNLANPQTQPSSRTGPHHSADDARYRQDEGQDQQQVPIYEALPGASSHLRQDDSDSGNSTDRSPKELRPGIPSKDPNGESRLVMSTTVPTLHNRPNNGNLSDGKSAANPPMHSNPNVPNTTRPPAGANNDKVMIVSGDSQNMVVDLSAVPLDLRDAIISGTALVTLPDGLNQQLEPGYTMITLPQDHEYERIPPYPYSDKGKSSQPKHSSKEDKSKYGTKNMTHVWDVMQHSSSGNAGKGKRITTVIPYHPNQDAHHTAADFTIEGTRLALQTKRVKKLKKRRCCCRICGVIVFLLAFLGVIVTLSLVYTNGKNYFGSV